MQIFMAIDEKKSKWRIIQIYMFIPRIISIRRITIIYTMRLEKKRRKIDNCVA